MRWILLLLAMPFVQTKLYSQNKMKHLYNVQKNTFLDSLLNKNEQLKPLLSRAKELNIQIIYTRIDRDENNIPTFTDYTYQLNHNYFYPASTVKMPIAFLALEKLQELSKNGIDKSTTMITDSSYPKQTMVLTHPSAQNSNPTIEHYIKQIFLVSDNNAFNRLYEFLGTRIHSKSIC
jgi:cell division protein FtsI/penicillin-binding protein 2